MVKTNRICVGRRRCVRERTMSRNSCEFGTGAISFQVVFMLTTVLDSHNWEESRRKAKTREGDSVLQRDR